MKCIVLPVYCLFADPKLVGLAFNTWELRTETREEVTEGWKLEGEQFVYDLAAWGLWVYTAEPAGWCSPLDGVQIKQQKRKSKQTWPGLQMGQRADIFPHCTSPHLLALSSHCVSADTPTEGLSAMQPSQRCWPRIYALHKSIEPHSGTQIKFFAFHSFL